MKARRPSRRHGLQRPLSSPQIVVLILYPLITACFFALAAEGMLPAEQAPAVLGVHAVAVALAVASWAACSLLDPREEGVITEHDFVAWWEAQQQPESYG